MVSDVGDGEWTIEAVLILVVMEYGLRPTKSSRPGTAEPVLILVVMEYGLRLISHHKSNITKS